MFNLNKTGVISMGLRKMTADYISMSKNHLGYEDKATKFKYNTSGYERGGREYILATIKRKLVGQTNLHKDVNEFYQRLLEKVESSSDDFDVNLRSMDKLDKYVFQNIDWLFSTIFTELKLKKGDDYNERFISEEDRSNDESIKLTTEDELFRQGKNNTEYKDLDFTDDEARKLLVKTLDLLKVCQDTLLQTDNNHINALKLLQAGQAHSEFVETQLDLENLYGDNGTDSQIIKANKKTDFIASFGFSYNANIKQVAKRRLAEDYISKDQRLLNAYRDLLKACNHLEIPIIELDAETIMDDEYIRKLRIALNSKQTVCVSEYDLNEFEIPLTSIDLKKKYIRSELLKNEVPKKRLQHYFNRQIMDEIYSIKACDFRKLDTIVADIKHSHNSYVENDKFAGHKEGEKEVKKMMEESQEYKRRVKFCATTLLFGYGTYKTSKEDTDVYEGVFSERSMYHIKKETNKWFERLLSEDPDKYSAYAKSVRHHFINKSDRIIIADGNGFLKYEDNGHYLEIVGEEFGDKGPSNKKFIFNKWLVNEKGYIVSKFLDAEPKVREELKVYRTPNKDSLLGLIIKTIDGKVICNGIQE